MPHESRGPIPNLSTFWVDTKLGLRMLGKHWALALIGGVAMAAAITLAASVFELIHVLGGTQLPLEEGDRVVVVQPFDMQSREGIGASVQDFERWRDGMRTVEDIGAFRILERDLATAAGPRLRVRIAEMSAAGFRTARVAPLMGRTLQAEDEDPGAPPVVVIGFDAWTSAFAADPDIVGRTIQLDGSFHTVIGVMPEGFAFPLNDRYWTRLTAGPPDRITAYGRLATGASLDDANAEVQTIGLAGDVPTGAGAAELRPRVAPYVVGVAGEPDAPLLAFLPLILPLLLIPPCANIAILIYARSIARRGEFAARAALGATRGRIIGQIFVEAFVLAAGAMILAFLLTPRLVDFIRFNLFVGGLPFWMDFGLSWPTIGYGAVLAVVAASISGAIPAIRATGRWHMSALHALGGRAAPRLGAVWTFLVLVQVGLSVAVLPIGVELAWALSGPAVRGTTFAPEEYLTARPAMDPGAEAGPVRFVNAVDELVQRLRDESGASGVTVAQSLPSQEDYVEVEIEDADAIERTVSNRVDPAFFGLFDVRLLAGREFASADRDPGSAAAIVNRSFAEHAFGEANPLGRRLRTVDRGIAMIDGRPVQRDQTGPWLEIVGVVEDFSREGGRRTLYLPLPRVPGRTPLADNRADSPAPPLSIAIHMGPVDLSELSGRLRAIAAEVDPGLRIEPVVSLDAVYESFWIQDLTLASGLAGVTLGIVMFSIAGIYTLMSFTVVERRREIGIRSALGAPPWRLVLGIFRRVLVPVSIGVALGGFAAILVDHYVAAYMFDFREGGRPLPWVLPAAEALLIGVGILAAARPAREALHVDVVEYLRVD